MTDFKHSLRNDIVKVVLSSAWVAVVALGCQHYTAARNLRSAHTHVIPVSVTSQLDSTLFSRIWSEDGLLEISGDGPFQPAQAARVLDSAIKNVGLDRVAVSASVKGQAGNEIRSELAKLGYRKNEIARLFANAPPNLDFTAGVVR